jgi:hypothetical protein
MAGDRKMEGVAPSHANPSRQSLVELLRRVEASGPDRKLDDALWSLLERGEVVGLDLTGGYVLPSIPALTASLDAALGLVERVLPGCSHHVLWEPSHGAAGFSYAGVRSAGLMSHSSIALPGKREPIAILAALLLALIASEGTLDGSAPPTPTLEVKP